MTSPMMMPTRRADHAATVRFVRPAPRPVFFDEADPHCFVCHRHTDHFAEHDELVDAGLAAYGSDGSVYRTDAYDEDLARAVFEAAYAARHSA
jgi:hypothetical protein